MCSSGLIFNIVSLWNNISGADSPSPTDSPVEHVLQPISQLMHSPVSGSCTCPRSTGGPAQRESVFRIVYTKSDTEGSAFTYVAGRRLADPVLEFVAFPTFGTYVAICAEFTISYAGQAGVVTPVRIQSPGAVCPTTTLMEEALLSIFV